MLQGHFALDLIFVQKRVTINELSGLTCKLWVLKTEPDLPPFSRLHSGSLLLDSQFIPLLQKLTWIGLLIYPS